jgi:hypothetical protein
MRLNKHDQYTCLLQASVQTVSVKHVSAPEFFEQSTLVGSRDAFVRAWSQKHYLKHNIYIEMLHSHAITRDRACTIQNDVCAQQSHKPTVLIDGDQTCEVVLMLLLLLLVLLLWSLALLIFFCFVCMHLLIFPLKIVLFAPAFGSKWLMCTLVIVLTSRRNDEQEYRGCSRNTARCFGTIKVRKK